MINILARCRGGNTFGLGDFHERKLFSKEIIPFIFILHLIALSRLRYETASDRTSANPSFLERDLEQSLNT